MAELQNQKILKIADKNKIQEAPSFITEDVVEVRRAKLIYYKWISRLMALLATGAMLYTVCATLAILKLVPEMMIDPQIFVELSDSQSLVKREYINHKMTSRERVMVNFIKQYVELRNTFIKDEAEMQKRWLWGGLISYLSTYKVYKAFEKEYPKLTEEMVQKKASRSVEIKSVERSGGENSYIWKVEFKTYDYSFNESSVGMRQDVDPIITEQEWTANIRCLVDPNRRIAYRRLINPLGFVVIRYSQSKIEN
ncbi:MAG: type IV secretion system protein [Acetobacter sp.]|nr:type IV secretion system protein [Acetobacter sp.]